MRGSVKCGNRIQSVINNRSEVVYGWPQAIKSGSRQSFATVLGSDHFLGRGTTEFHSQTDSLGAFLDTTIENSHNLHLLPSRFVLSAPGAKKLNFSLQRRRYPLQRNLRTSSASSARLESGPNSVRTCSTTTSSLAFYVAPPPVAGTRSLATSGPERWRSN